MNGKDLIMGEIIKNPFGGKRKRVSRLGSSVLAQKAAAHSLRIVSDNPLIAPIIRDKVAKLQNELLDKDHTHYRGFGF